MDGSQIVKRYADGFLEFAKETIGFKEGLEEMGALRSVLRDNPEFKSLLENPAIGYSEKCATLNNALGKSFSRETLILLMLLLKKDRIHEFDHIAEYARVKYAHGDEVEAVLKASYPLDTAVLERIKRMLEETMEKKLHIYMNLAPELLGGVRAEIGHFVIDGSLKRRLVDLRRKLMAVRMN
jgi:F-type H+-transporting ATPase subunit delta